MLQSTTFRRGVAFAVIVIAVVPLSIWDHTALQGDDTPPFASEFRADSTAEYAWRMTRFGWQDSTLWYVDPYTPQPKVELIHPLVWAAWVLIAVLAATVWATEEWEWAQCVKRVSAFSSEDQKPKP